MSTPKKSPAGVHSTAQLALALGLSRWTVSRVLNGHPGISADTVALVREGMKKFGFTPSPLAQGLRRGRTDYIGVCLPELEGFYLGPKLELLRRDLAAKGFHLMAGMTNGSDDDELKMLRQFSALRMAAIISIASKQSPLTLKSIDQNRTPLLLIDPFHENARDAIMVDRSTGMRQAALHLFDHGHRTLTLAGFSSASPYAQMRLKGVRSACDERSLPWDKTVHQIPCPQTDESYFKQGFRLAAEISRQAPRPTAVLALNDQIALGLIDGLRSENVAVPGEISVIGYDNMEAGAHSLPRLTSIDARSDALMDAATTEVISRIGGQTGQRRKLPRIATELIVRASGGPAPAMSP